MARIRPAGGADTRSVGGARHPAGYRRSTSLGLARVAAGSGDQIESRCSGRRWRERPLHSDDRTAAGDRRHSPRVQRSHGEGLTLDAHKRTGKPAAARSKTRKRHTGGNDDVERVHPVADRNAHVVVRQRQCCVAQAAAF